MRTSHPTNSFTRGREVKLLAEYRLVLLLFSVDSGSVTKEAHTDPSEDTRTYAAARTQAAAASGRAVLAAAVSVLCACVGRHRAAGAFPPGWGLAERRRGLSGVVALLRGTGRGRHGEAERGDASVPLQGGLQGPDGGEEAGLWAGRGVACPPRGRLTRRAGTVPCSGLLCHERLQGSRTCRCCRCPAQGPVLVYHGGEGRAVIP